MIPGEYKVKPGYIELNIGRATCLAKKDSWVSHDTYIWQYIF